MATCGLWSTGSGRSYMCSGYMYRLNTVKVPSTMFMMINQRVMRLMKLAMCSAVGSRVMKGLSSGCTGYLFRNCLRRYDAYASPKTMPSQSRVLVIMCVCPASYVRCLYLPNITTRRHQTICTMSQGGSDAYQRLPDSLLAVRNPLVVLAWSTNCYQPADLAPVSYTHLTLPTILRV